MAWYKTERRARDPEYRAKDNEWARERRRERYNTDPEFKSRVNAQQRKQYAQARRLIYEVLWQTGCKYCGERDPACLQFHHRDPKMKKANVPALAQSRKAVNEEMKKCDIVCANCHCKIHKYGNVAARSEER